MSLGPAALVRSLPAALGRQPTDELVIVGVSDLYPTTGVILLVGLEDTDTEEGAMEVADSLHLLMDGARRDGARKVVILVYADDAMTPNSTPARLSATAVAHAEAAGLGVLDAIAVSRGRWRSFDCTNPSCCPPDGHLITGDPTP